LSVCVVFYCLPSCDNCIEQEIIAISCSWCKEAYHNRMQCFMVHLMTEPCSFGNLCSVIVPPSWIIRTQKLVSTFPNRYNPVDRKQINTVPRVPDQTEI
ncbi:hypothetical protein Ciccas_004652, partial [Cichlidogyrus casuarinus]